MNYLSMDIALFVAGYLAAVFTWDKLRSFVTKEEEAAKVAGDKIKAKIKSKL